MLMVLLQGGSMKSFKRCRDTICNLDDKFHYCSDAKKSWLAIKEDFKEENIFKGSAAEITSAARKNLESAIGKKHQLKRNT